jgi:hypothetical protein
MQVRPGGLEPPTNSLEGCCSIHLSYGRVVTAQQLTARGRGTPPNSATNSANLIRPRPAAQGGEPLLEHPLVLLHAVLHHLRAVPHSAQVAVDPLYQALAPVP